MATLARWQGTITNEAGDVVPNASVEVRDEATGDLAALKSNRAGTIGIGNPATADDDGFVFFYVVGGAYRIVASAPGFTREWRHVGVGTAQEHDAPVDGLGTVKSITVSGGIETPDGQPITVTGSIRAAQIPSSVAGTAYTFVDDDRARLKVFDNAGEIAATLPQAGSGDPAEFLSGWFSMVLNSGAGLLTITPTTSVINGGASISLKTGEAAFIFSNGANYRAIKVPPAHTHLIADITDRGELSEFDIDDLFAWVTPAACSAASNEITFDVEDGTSLFRTRTMAANETLLNLENCPVGVCVTLDIDPAGFTLSFDTDYLDDLPDVERRATLQLQKISADEITVTMNWQEPE